MWWRVWRCRQTCGGWPPCCSKTTSTQHTRTSDQRTRISLLTLLHASQVMAADHHISMFTAAVRGRAREACLCVLREPDSKACYGESTQQCYGDGAIDCGAAVAVCGGRGTHGLSTRLEPTLSRHHPGYDPPLNLSDLDGGGMCAVTKLWWAVNMCDCLREIMNICDCLLEITDIGSRSRIPTSWCNCAHCSSSTASSRVSNVMLVQQEITIRSPGYATTGAAEALLSASAM